jgi:ADP-heptose:LPS heptosyltransferase
MLLFGDFVSGWSLYEWRWKTKQNLGKQLETSKPVWQGQRDVNIFLWAEQGIGDEIMFASLIPELEERCVNLTVKCDERLVPLFERSFSEKTNFQFEQNNITEDTYDFHIPIASLPSILRPSLDSFNQASNAYLQCDSKKADELRRMISKDNEETLIGISWSSSAAQPGSHHRNIPLSDLAKHLHAPGVKLVNLQYGDVTDEIAKLKDDHGIEVIEMPNVDNRNDIDALAALIMACDEVVSIDNATVHLAGALGAKTRILLPFNRNWQWGTSGSSSYWYGSVELYRQQYANDWKQVLEQLKTNIGMLVKICNADNHRIKKEQ